MSLNSAQQTIQRSTNADATIATTENAAFVTQAKQRLIDRQIIRYIYQKYKDIYPTLLKKQPLMRLVDLPATVDDVINLYNASIAQISPNNKPLDQSLIQAQFRDRIQIKQIQGNKLKLSYKQQNYLLQKINTVRTGISKGISGLMDVGSLIGGKISDVYTNFTTNTPFQHALAASVISLDEYFQVNNMVSKPYEALVIPNDTATMFAKRFTGILKLSQFSLQYKSPQQSNMQWIFPAIQISLLKKSVAAYSDFGLSLWKSKQSDITNLRVRTMVAQIWNFLATNITSSQIMPYYQTLLKGKAFAIPQLYSIETNISVEKDDWFSFTDANVHQKITKSFGAQNPQVADLNQYIAQCVLGKLIPIFGFGSAARVAFKASLKATQGRINIASYMFASICGSQIQFKKIVFRQLLTSFYGKKLDQKVIKELYSIQIQRPANLFFFASTPLYIPAVNANSFMYPIFIQFGGNKTIQVICNGTLDPGIRIIKRLQFDFSTKKIEVDKYISSAIWQLTEDILRSYYQYKRKQKQRTLVRVEPAVKAPPQNGDKARNQFDLPPAPAADSAP